MKNQSPRELYDLLCNAQLFTGDLVSSGFDPITVQTQLEMVDGPRLRTTHFSLGSLLRVEGLTLGEKDGEFDIPYFTLEQADEFVEKLGGCFQPEAACICLPCSESDWVEIESETIYGLVVYQIAPGWNWKETPGWSVPPLDVTIDQFQDLALALELRAMKSELGTVVVDTQLLRLLIDQVL